MDEIVSVSHNGTVVGRSVTQATVGALVGAFAWTATEYATHRWVLHGPFGAGRLKRLPLGRLHRLHHREPAETSTVARGAGHLAMAGIAAMTSVAATTVAPTIAARSAAVAWASGYSVYEINHWNFHHRPAHTALGQKLRNRHHRHHFGAPASNLGVTMSFWDHLFGTEAPDE